MNNQGVRTVDMILFPWEDIHLLNKCENTRYYYLVGWKWKQSDNSFHIIISSAIPVQLRQHSDIITASRHFASFLDVFSQQNDHLLTFRNIKLEWLGIVSCNNSSLESFDILNTLILDQRISIILSMNQSFKLKVNHTSMPSGSVIFYLRKKYRYHNSIQSSIQESSKLHDQIILHFHSHENAKALKRRDIGFYLVSTVSHCITRSEFVERCLSKKCNTTRVFILSNVIKQSKDIARLFFAIISSCYILYIKLVRFSVFPLISLSSVTKSSYLLRKLANCSYSMSIYKIIDHILGILIGIIWLQNKDSFARLLERLFNTYIIDTPNQYIDWMTSWPAGLKLNGEFGKFQGEMFHCMINIYNKTVSPLLSPDFPFSGWMIYLLSYFGCFFGLGTFLSFSVDIFRMLCFNISIFQTVSSRLFSVHLQYILDLFRLFQGKRKNVLRHRIDRHAYDIEQLLLGTIIFALLIFLFPTTAAYYLLFTLWRLSMNAIIGTIYMIINLIDHYIENAYTKTHSGYTIRIAFKEDLEHLFLFLDPIQDALPLSSRLNSNFFIGPDWK